MKISQGVRTLYTQNEPLYRRLGEHVKGWLSPRVEENGWFFRGRVKSLESFALKLETGRVSQPERCEDFFGCTIIVRTAAEVIEAERLVRSHYNVAVRRPFDDGETSKAASSFIFDDLRLYAEQPPSASGRDLDLDGLPFEVQIKTILQEAWSVATHDLIYKSDAVSWPLERIAFQVKAMLEHAEVAIAEAPKLAATSSLAKQNKATADITKVIKTLSSVWDPEQLPSDRKRLAENVYGLLRLCRIDVERLHEIIQSERTRVGLLPANLSPYAFIVQAFANNADLELKRSLERSNNRQSIFVHNDMDLPIWMRAEHSKIIRL